MNAASLLKTLSQSSGHKIQTNKLKIDEAYQRPINKATVNKIVAKFIPAAFHALLVGKRSNGQYFVVDGQQRLHAARRLEMSPVLCSVFESEGRAHEAAIFKACNADRTGVASIYVYRACLWSGEERTMEIDKIVRDCGFRVPKGNDKHWPNIRCTGVLYSIWGKGQQAKRDALYNALTTIAVAWDGDDEALRSYIIGGLGTFYWRLRDQDVDVTRVIEKLAKIKPIHLHADIDAARKWMGGHSRLVVFAQHVVNLYNKGLRSNKLKWPE